MDQMSQEVHFCVWVILTEDLPDSEANQPLTPSPLPPVSPLSLFLPFFCTSISWNTPCLLSPSTYSSIQVPATAGAPFPLMPPFWAPHRLSSIPATLVSLAGALLSRIVTGELALCSVSVSALRLFPGSRCACQTRAQHRALPLPVHSCPWHAQSTPPGWVLPGSGELWCLLHLCHSAPSLALSTVFGCVLSSQQLAKSQLTDTRSVFA